MHSASTVCCQCFIISSLTHLCSAETCWINITNRNMSPLPGGPSWQILLIAVVVLLVIKRLYYELTTGASRRRMIKEHGCQPVWQYPHQGVLGKTLGIDLIKDVMKAGKAERPNEATRERFFKNGRTTVQFRLLRSTCMLTVA